jgi:DNA-directed RNA polymerase specialized sigma24 family protein
VTHDGTLDVRARSETTAVETVTTPSPEDFGVVYDAHFHDIYRYIAGRLGPDLADEIAADTLSHEEIAQTLGIPYGTVGSRLNRARKKVRTMLGEDVNG